MHAHMQGGGQASIGEEGKEGGRGEVGGWRGGLGGEGCGGCLPGCHACKHTPVQWRMLLEVQMVIEREELGWRMGEG